MMMAYDILKWEPNIGRDLCMVESGKPGASGKQPWGPGAQTTEDPMDPEFG